MSQADELLDNLLKGVTLEATVDYEYEEHIVIGEDRFITVPESLMKIAVQFDHRVETVTFDCPRYWDGLDMSTLKVYVNYIRSDGLLGMYLAKNVVPDEEDSNIMHFEWTLTRNVTGVDGNLTFLVCTKKVDDEGNEVNHWNSELCTSMHVSSGLEVEEAIRDEYPDIITQLLVRMDYVEELVTPEAMVKHIEAFFAMSELASDTIKHNVYNYLMENNATLSELIELYIKLYMEQFPTVFVVGPHKPYMKSIWFDTAGVGGNTLNTTLIVGGTKPQSQCIWFDTGESVTTVDDSVMLTLTSDIVDCAVTANVDGANYGVENVTIEEQPTDTKYNFDII